MSFEEHLWKKSSWTMEENNNINKGLSNYHSLKKLIIWIRLIGVPVDLSGIDSKLFRFWSFNFGLIAFVANLIINLVAIISTKKPKSTGDWNNLITEVNLTFTLTMFHAGLVFMTVRKWKGFTTVLIRIEALNIFRREDYDRFNKICYVGLTSSIILALVAVGAGITLVFYPTAGFHLPIKVVFFVYLTTGIIVFVTLGWLLFTMLSILASKIDMALERSHSFGLGSQMDGWQACYHMICNAVNELNSCFGFCVLVFLIFSFIWTINGTFVVLMEFIVKGPSYGTFVALILLIASLVCFSVVVYVPHQIESEASDFAHQLRTLRPKDALLLQQAHNLMVEISLSPILFTVLGLVDVNLRLVPTLIGTTLTYIIILFQFTTADEA